MKHINAIIQSNDEPNILVGGLNSLDEQIVLVLVDPIWLLGNSPKKF